VQAYLLVEMWCHLAVLLFVKPPSQSIVHHDAERGNAENQNAMEVSFNSYLETIMAGLSRNFELGPTFRELALCA